MLKNDLIDKLNNIQGNPKILVAYPHEMVECTGYLSDFNVKEQPVAVRNHANIITIGVEYIEPIETTEEDPELPF
jgi:hypothetical protein